MKIQEVILDKKIVFVFFLILFLIIFFVPIVVADNSTVPTTVDIPNPPPRLLQPIPNQSWPSNQNLTEAFDLDDYFISDIGLTFNYSYSLIQNITIVINSSNSVSFYPDKNFIGTKTITFYASDGIYNISSNLVYLFVGSDIEAPQWNSPTIIYRIHRPNNTIYQNDYLNFSTIWTDNIALKNYIFSIDQGLGWQNYFGGTFTGVLNLSYYSIQVSAPGGTSANWMFCANDTTNNQNCTSIQSFNVSVRPTPSPPSGPPGGAGAGGGGAAFAYIMRLFKERKIKNFTVDPESFKVSLKQGSKETRILKIINTGNSNLSFNLSIQELEAFVSLSDYSFDLPFGDTRKVTVDFTAKKDTIPEQYFGTIMVRTAGDAKEVPVILNINPFEIKLDVNVNVNSEYKIVRPGEIVKANITVRNLKDVLPLDVKVYYAIKDLYGNIYDSYEENFIFSSILQFERNLTVPLNAREGEYIFYSRAISGKDSAIDSDSFQVGSKFNLLGLFSLTFIFIIIIIFVIFALILLFRYKKEKEKERVLTLYLMLNELKNLIKEDKFDNAVDLYIRIKSAYGEPVSKSAVENKEKLREEIKKLSEKLKSEIKEISEESEGKEKPKEKKEGGKKEKASEEKVKEEKKESVNELVVGGKKVEEKSEDDVKKISLGEKKPEEKKDRKNEIVADEIKKDDSKPKAESSGKNKGEIKDKKDLERRKTEVSKEKIIENNKKDDYKGGIVEEDKREEKEKQKRITEKRLLKR